MKNIKVLFDNEPTISPHEKWFVITSGANNDYKLSYSSLLLQMKRDILGPYLEQQVGNLVVNTNNAKKGIKKFNDGYLEYLLCDNTEYFLDDYPLLKDKVQTFNDNNGRAKFRTFDFINRTLKGAAIDVNLGATQEDAIKAHNHGMGHDHDMAHTHDMTHQHNFDHKHAFGWERDAGGTNTVELGSHWGDFTSFLNLDQRQNTNITTGGRTTTGNSSKSLTSWSRSTTDSTGEIETRMKNVAVNMYLVAGVFLKNTNNDDNNKNKKAINNSIESLKKEMEDKIQEMQKKLASL
jgi:hypothetical protein